MSLGSSLLLVSFLFLFYGSTIILHSHARCIEKEKQALLDFKLSFFEDPSGALSSWSIEHDDCCHWHGVDCFSDPRHVDRLNLAGKDLKSNKLRPSLLELQHLTSLDLSGNQFTMRIPTFIGSLGNLTTLDLSHSGFFGEIPPHLGNLSKLVCLSMGSDELDGVQYYYSNSLYSNGLHWLSRLSSLEYLDLGYVNLSNAVDWVSVLTKLPSLCWFYCKSCSLPQPLVSSHYHANSSSPTLQELYIAGNNLSNLSFVGMVFSYSLTILNASSNPISQSLPEILHYLPPYLTYLDLSSNMLNDVVLDVHFSKFHRLECLKLSDNNFLTLNFSKSWVPPFQLTYLNLRSCKVGPGFPHWVLAQTNLNYVDLSNSGISGVLPNSFWNIYHFSVFNLSHNQISGMVPNSNIVSHNPVLLDLSYNAFTGPIPLPLFGASFLFLSNNKFSSFPPFHPQQLLPMTMIIDLSNNHLSGTLPDWLFQYVELRILNLANNKLSGALPREIGSLCPLVALHLRNNLFSGELPLSMENCNELVILELANNKFSGVVPSWLGESMSTNLSILTLSSNNFLGDLPSSLCNLQSLQIMDLSDNRLSGTIPACLHNLSSMAIKKDFNFLDNYDTDIFEEMGWPIEYKDFESVVWKGALVELNSRNLEEHNVVNLSGNLLRGEIPIGVTALKELRSLDLSRNELNGTIPDKIGQLTSLELLKLSSNRLCGEIPRSLGDLTFLGTLNLSNNNLSGQIPTGTQLQGFYPSSFAGNPKLCGKPLATMCPCWVASNPHWICLGLGFGPRVD